MDVRRMAIDWLRGQIPQRHRRRLTMARLAARRPTAPLRDLPSFLIIGTERGGTSSLYKYLGMHPEVAPSLRKETEYFNRYFERGEDWYRAHFPLRARRQLAEARGGKLLAFEASPFYILDPRVPERVAALLPRAKFIVLLRNPVARALSKWRHFRELGFEDLDFSEALQAEQDRIAGEFDKMVADPAYYSRPFFRFSYLEGGKYADQLRRWLDRFGRESFLFIKSEDFYLDTPRVYQKIVSFLGLRAWQPESFKMYSSATSADPAAAAGELPDELRRRLEEYFAPHNAELANLLGQEFNWFDGS